MSAMVTDLCTIFTAGGMPDAQFLGFGLASALRMAKLE
ncbi:hypothetical protein DSM25558_1573 [Agrobacterium sp. DSM 25558]|uniref:Uncharacterized protein n=1 Tax=Agrobacterium rosae TaxID=1972867 RepID=A0A1R3TY54_9HYPH|nr:hypothetical protein DSM25558_1573 [Agrobacterium sp. DSM 25558]SCX23893.1 hypothetical protein DSM25559_2465 [Agrobacterium rosae]